MNSFFKPFLAGLLLLCLRSHAQTALTVTQVAAQGLHAMFILSDGSLWGMGFDDQGQLGLGPPPTNNSYIVDIPRLVVSNGVTAVSCGPYHSAFIKSDGSLWVMGDNYNGQLGDGTVNHSFVPKKIVASGVVSVACGFSHTLYKVRTVTGIFPHQTTTISLYGMGGNGNGQLGDGTTNDHLSPILINSTNSIIVTPMAAGGNCSLFIRPDGTLWGMGANGNGQLGDGTTNDSHTPEVLVNAFLVNGITSTGANTFFIQADGSLWGTGANHNSELGDGTQTERHSFVKVATNVINVATTGAVTLFVKSDGSLWGTGNDEYYQLFYYDLGTATPVKLISSGVTAVALNTASGYFTRSDGSLWGGGDDVVGELGDGFEAYNYLLPLQIYPFPPIIIHQTSISSGTNLHFVGYCGLGGNYVLLSSTNLLQPRSLWSPLSTNLVYFLGASNYNVTLTNGFHANESRRFYTLVHQ